MTIDLKKNKPLIIAASVVAGLILAVILAEIVFFAKNKKWYKDVGLHVRQSRRVGEVKDKNLLPTYYKKLLHRPPTSDSALREYVELINIKKEDGAYRIVCIGGSTTQGVGLPREEKYPFLLEQILDERHPGRFEVLNLGLHGANTRNFFQRFHKASKEANFGWKDLDVDLVIICPVWNDFIFALKSKVEDSIWESSKASVKKHLSSRLALGYYIYLSLEIIQQRMAESYYNKSDEFFARQLELEKDRFRNRLADVVEQWQGVDARVYLLLLPGLVEEGWSDELLKKLSMKTYGDSKEWFLLHRKFPIMQKFDYEIIKSVSKEYGASFVDLSIISRDFSLEERLDRKNFQDAIHFGPQVSYWIAEGLSKTILQETDN